MPADFRVWSLGELPIVSPPAEIDIANASSLRSALISAGNRAGHIVIVDMTRTTFCDSSALSVLVRAHSRALAGGGELRLVIRDSSLLRIFAVTGLDRMLRIFASLPAALAAKTAPLPQPSDPGRPATRR
jgi:anti-sigma B factor antagonist